MARESCANCQRAMSNCICKFVTPITNNVPVVILQHPKEVKAAKGTVALLAPSLDRCQVIVGEDFSENEELQSVLSRYQHAYLLYPSDDAKPITSLKPVIPKVTETEPTIASSSVLILIDATWKKAYRMFQLSKPLHALENVVLPEHLVGQYQIRKTKRAHALSTLEACCYALDILENRPEKYSPLLDNFIAFNHHQLQFRPPEHRD